jgi:hypothetical protein
MSMHNYNMRNNTETRENIDTIEMIVLDEDSDNDSDYSPNRSRKRVKHNNLLINIEDDNIKDDNIEHDDDDYYDEDDEGEEATENLIINKARSSVEGPKGAKNANGNITEMIAIYAGQQQLDNKEKEKLHKKISDLEKELDRLEIQQRYKNLETNNILIERDELKSKKEENEKVVKKTMEDFEKFHKKVKEKENLLEVRDGLYKFLLVMSGICNAYLYLMSFTYPECEESKSSTYF